MYRRTAARHVQNGISDIYQSTNILKENEGKGKGLKRGKIRAKEKEKKGEG